MSKSIRGALNEVNGLAAILEDRIRDYGDPQLRRPRLGLRVLAFGRNGYLPGELRYYPHHEKLAPIRFLNERSGMRILGEKGMRISMRFDRSELRDGVVDRPTGIMIAVPPRILISGLLEVVQSDAVKKLCELVDPLDDVEELRRVGWGVRRHLLRKSLPMKYWRPGLLTING